MFGHVESPRALGARTCSRSAACRLATGGFTEFVPLPFVHMEAPLWRKGLARSGPSWREAMLTHAVARLRARAGAAQRAGLLGEARFERRARGARVPAPTTSAAR
jgi:2-iminoacetate synthase ThiH